MYAPVGSSRQNPPAGYQPIPDVRVLVVDTGQETRTSASGLYRLNDIPTGTHQVAFSKEGYQAEVRQVEIVRGRLKQAEDVLLQPSSPGKGSVEGHLFAQGSELLAICSSVAPAGFLAVEGATVRTVDGQFQTTTDASGHYLLADLPAGQQVLELQKAGFQSLRFPVEVLAGQVICVGQKKKWTLMIFMNADNDLEDFAIQDLNELERIGSSNEVNIIVQVDRTPGFNSSNGDWTDTRRYRIVKDNDTSLINSPPLQFMGEVDMGDPRKAREFIEWAQLNYPAERYLFDFWNHGSGWRQRLRVPDPIRRGVSFDDSQGTEIETTELPGLLDVSDPIDIVIFDSSLMQMMEVAYEIRQRCDIVIGSEESPPGDGYPYHVWVGPLVENPAMSPGDWAGLIVRETIETLGPTFDVTQSALWTDRLDEVATALDALVEVLIRKGSLYKQAYRNARRDAQHYGFGSSQFAEYKDMVDYVQRLASETGDAEIAAKANLVAQALQDALIEEGHAGSSVAGSHGLSIWVPDPSNFLQRYRNLAFAKDTRWDDWIHSQGE